MRPFGATHLTIVILTVLSAVWLSRLCASNRISTRHFRFTMAALLAIQEIIRYAYFGYKFPNNLPIHLCTVTTWMAVVGCLTLHPLAIEFTYFTGIVGAGMALITPDLPKEVMRNWPSYPGIRYFAEHACIVIAASALVFGRIAPLRPGAVLRTNAQLVIYAIFLGIFNWQFGTNYMFLCRKPRSASLLDYMGPWPYYLLGAEILTLTLFWLLWLPARPRKAAVSIPHAASPSAAAGIPDIAEATRQ